MTPVEIRLPENAEVIYNSLYDTMNPDFLTQDIALVRVGDVFIDVGWYPEGDPSGSYRVSIYRGAWDNPLADPIMVKEAVKVANTVRQLAMDRSKTVHPQELKDMPAVSWAVDYPKTRHE